MDTDAPTRRTLRFGASLRRRLSHIRVRKDHHSPSPSSTHSISTSPIQSDDAPLSNALYLDPDALSLPLTNPPLTQFRRSLRITPDARHLSLKSLSLRSSASLDPKNDPVKLRSDHKRRRPVPHNHPSHSASFRHQRSRAKRNTPTIDTPSHLPRNAHVHSFDTSSAQLDFSPVELYESTSPQAERVATALERIAKQDFVRSAATDLPPQNLRDAMIPLIVESMQQHYKDPKVADRALSTLRRLTVSETCRRYIGEYGGIEAILSIMTHHSLRVRIQTQACLALANLAYKNMANKKLLLQANGLQIIVAALSIHRNVEHVQAWGCLAIRNITNGATSNAHDASVAAGAVEVLIGALEQYPNSTVVQQQSIIALTNIAASSKIGMERIRSVGGILALIFALRNNLPSSSLSQIALACARVLVGNEKNQQLFGHHGGVEVVKRVMDEHRGHVGIAVKGCATFRQLAFQRENREKIGSCGGIRIIISAMSDIVDPTPEAACQMLKALSNTIFDSKENKMLAGRLGAIVATLKLMSRSTLKHDVNVGEDGCRVLRNLLDGVLVNHELFLKNKGIAVVVATARLHGTSRAGVAEHSVAIFVNLAANHSVAHQLRDGSSDILTLAGQLERMHVGNAQIEKQVGDLTNCLEGESGNSNSTRVNGREGGGRSRGSLERALRSSRTLRRAASKENNESTSSNRLRSVHIARRVR